MPSVRQDKTAVPDERYQHSTTSVFRGLPEITDLFYLLKKRCFSFTLDGTEESRCRSVQGIGPVSTGTTATAHLRFHQIRQVQQVAEVDANSDDSESA
ncbi:hypothetical protein KCU66_g33, partial [Aureobasidium melanogenum]